MVKTGVIAVAVVYKRTCVPAGVPIVAEKVTEPAPQRITFITSGKAGGVFTTVATTCMRMLRHPVAELTASAKKVVVDSSDGVEMVYGAELSEPMAMPPFATVYSSIIVPAGVVIIKLSVTMPCWQRVAPMEVGAPGLLFTVTVTGTRALSQPLIVFVLLTKKVVVVVIVGVVKLKGETLSMLSGGRMPVDESYKRASLPPVELKFTLIVPLLTSQIEAFTAIGLDGFG